MPQSTATRGWDSRRVQAAITEATRSNPSVNAPTTTAPPAGQSLAEPAEPVRKKKKAMKRRAADPQPCCGPAASVRAAPPERHSTGRIAGPHRTPTSPLYSHATRTPARPVGLPRPPGSGQKGVGAGVTTPPYQRPRAAGAFDSFVPGRWGPRLRWAAASRHSTPPGRPSRTMVTYSIVRSGLVVELSEPLPGGAVRMPTPRMPPHVGAGMTAEITALLNKGVIEPTADHPRLCLSLVFSSPSVWGIFVWSSTTRGSIAT